MHSRFSRNVKKYGQRNSSTPRGKTLTLTSKNFYENEGLFRSISKDDARDQIERYVTQHPGSLTSQIIEALRIDPITTVDVLNELKHEGSVQSQAV